MNITYRSHVMDFAAHCPKPLGEVRRQDVRDYMMELRTRKAYHRQQKNRSTWAVFCLQS